MVRRSPQRAPGLILAIAGAGGVSALARQLGLSQPSVSRWRRVPAERVVEVEAASGVPRELLRPDLFRPDSPDSPELREAPCHPPGDQPDA